MDWQIELEEAVPAVEKEACGDRDGGWQWKK